MKIYTKTGDSGETGMLGGKRVMKSCLEMEAIGEMDELNAELGIMNEELGSDFVKEKKKLIAVQHNLFVIGANLAALQTSGIKIEKLGNSEIKKLEKWIDAMQKDLPVLKNFILPGGCEEAAICFRARAVCRRAERVVIKLSEKYKVDSEIKKYLNRLSDCLFVLARWLNHQAGVEEVKWKK